MTRTKPAKIPEGTAQEIARTLVDRYFSESFNHLPGAIAVKTDLAYGAMDVEEALDRDNPGSEVGTWAHEAGFLIGVEVGRRLGSAR